jgi:hypothetical protein
MPMFQRRHYEAIAKVLSKYTNTGRDLRPMIKDFETLFYEDNPNFQRAKFRIALGGYGY